MAVAMPAFGRRVPFLAQDDKDQYHKKPTKFQIQVVDHAKLDQAHFLLQGRHQGNQVEDHAKLLSPIGHKDIFASKVSGTSSIRK